LSARVISPNHATKERQRPRREIAEEVGSEKEPQKVHDLIQGVIHSLDVEIERLWLEELQRQEDELRRKSAT